MQIRIVSNGSFNNLTAVQKNTAIGAWTHILSLSDFSVYKNLSKEKGSQPHCQQDRGSTPGLNPGTVVSLREDAWHSQQSNHQATKAV